MDNSELTALTMNREPKCDPQTYRELVQMLRFWEKKFPEEFAAALAKVTIDKNPAKSIIGR